MGTHLPLSSSLSPGDEAPGSTECLDTGQSVGQAPWDSLEQCCTLSSSCPHCRRRERYRRRGQSWGAEPSRESGREKPATNNLK